MVLYVFEVTYVLKIFKMLEKLLQHSHHIPYTYTKIYQLLCWLDLKGGIRIQFRMRIRNRHGLKSRIWETKNCWIRLISMQWTSILQTGEASHRSPYCQPNQRASLTDQVNSLLMKICDAASLSGLLIRNVHPGSRIRIFSIPDPHQRI
jgi:hypothetical protein